MSIPKSLACLFFKPLSSIHWVFAILTLVPVILQKECITLSDWSNAFSFFKDKVRSSACCIVFISVEPLILIPGISSFSLIFNARISATNKYNIAEIGHPCLIPLFILHVFETHPWFLMRKIGLRKIGLVYKILIQDMKFGPKLKFSRVLNRKFHSTESKAFSKSKRSNSPSVSDDSQKSKISNINLASCFLLSFVEFRSAVSEEKSKMWKFTPDGRTTDGRTKDGALWQ